MLSLSHHPSAPAFLSTTIIALANSMFNTPEAPSQQVTQSIFHIPTSLFLLRISFWCGSGESSILITFFSIKAGGVGVGD